MINGHDRGPLGLPFHPDRAAVEKFHRRVGCAFLVALGVGMAVGLMLCGALGAIWWRW